MLGTQTARHLAWPLTPWRGGRVVDCSGLKNRRPIPPYRSVGSNPTPAALTGKVEPNQRPVHYYKACVYVKSRATGWWPVATSGALPSELREQMELWRSAPHCHGERIITMIEPILLVFAFVLACLAAYSIPAGRWSLGWAALAFYFASLLFGSLHPLLLH